MPPAWLAEAEAREARVDRMMFGGHAEHEHEHDHDHVDEPTGLEQSLDELEFLRSACAAAQAGDAPRLRRMLSRSTRHVETDGAGGSTGYTPLHYAARSGSAECVALLLQHGARVDAQTAGGATPLHRAAHQGHTQVCAMLLDAGASALIADDGGETPLHKAMRERRAEAGALLLGRAPAAARRRDNAGRTPMELAAACGPLGAGEAGGPLLDAV
jgi:ankyrin repeat protein